jgi:hypothetical protein
MNIHCGYGDVPLLYSYACSSVVQHWVHSAHHYTPTPHPLPPSSPRGHTHVDMSPRHASGFVNRCAASHSAVTVASRALVYPSCEISSSCDSNFLGGNFVICKEWYAWITTFACLCSVCSRTLSLPNVSVALKWWACLLCSREVADSKLMTDTGYPNELWCGFIQYP